MTKNKEELLSNQIFHNWKNHKCTKALLKILLDSREAIEYEILEIVLKKGIDKDRLLHLQGAYLELKGIEKAIKGEEAKIGLEEKMEVEDE